MSTKIYASQEWVEERLLNENDVLDIVMDLGLVSPVVNENGMLYMSLKMVKNLYHLDTLESQFLMAIMSI